MTTTGRLSVRGNLEAGGSSSIDGGDWKDSGDCARCLLGGEERILEGGNAPSRLCTAGAETSLIEGLDGGASEDEYGSRLENEVDNVLFCF